MNRREFLEAAACSAVAALAGCRTERVRENEALRALMGLVGAGLAAVAISAVSLRN